MFPTLSKDHTWVTGIPEIVFSVWQTVLNHFFTLSQWEKAILSDQFSVSETLAMPVK